LKRAREATERAIELDEGLGAAHAELGWTRSLDDWDFPGARSAFERAVELSPNDPAALTGLALHLSLVEGKSSEAELLFERLVQVAPLDLYYRPFRMLHFGFAREYQRAIAEAERLWEIDPEFADPTLPIIFFLAGRPEDASREMLAFWARVGSEPLREAFERGAEEGGARGDYGPRYPY
jgi:tetratricopeptide (TPR) repeat protein